MHVAIFIGSPRYNGNTSTMASILSTSLIEKGAECRSFHLYKHKIEPCLDCRLCKLDDMTCAQLDDMTVLYENIEWADVIIFGTPIYWFGPSAQTKLLIDRFRPYFANKKLYGKRAALLLPAGSGMGDCDVTIEQFQRIFKALGMIYIDTVAIQAYDENDVRDDEKHHDQLRDLVDKIMTEEMA
ncbi:flavodoxin family protein [Carboxylicivirga mesophila]|uniref:Flavodoxin family protein n=1 Tax=Carboxylicivirga mesophila TaxID=1166478 RepID=A0ABS5KGR6_9BACT|nr:flavodoxin family protein [Carboxylicivirga mesophila]MBS2213691.1 flavodoxin family protein [Carboxylicivirga mesophila]